MKTPFLFLSVVGVFFVIVSPPVFAEEEFCLEFSQGTDTNKVADFLKFIEMDDESVKEEYSQKPSSKFYELYKASSDRLYSSSYDLDGDGKVEYFYYFNAFWMCGVEAPMGMGCPLDIYAYKDGRFRSLMRQSLYPNAIKRDKFDPESNKQDKYICIIEKKDGRWKGLKIDGRIEHYLY